MLERRYSRPIHRSWLVATACLGIVVGLVVSLVFWLPFHSLQWMLLAILFIIFGFKNKKMYVLPLVLVAGLLIGAVRGNAYAVDVQTYELFNGQVVELSGKVADDTDIGKAHELVLRLKDVVIGGKDVGGFVWLTTNSDAIIKRGDTVTVKGKLGDGFGSFAASMYRAELINISRPMPGDVALKVRDWFADAIRLAIPEPEASLGVGYLVGQRRALPEDLDAALKAAGLTHVVVASGYNLTILVNISRRLFLKLSKFLALFFSGGMILTFIAITGVSPSMSRAGLVTGLGLVAWYYGRKFHPVILLLVAAAITLLFQPAYAKGDLGWQLSFASFAGVLIVAPLLQKYFFGEDEPRVLRQVFFETLSAWICTVPLIILVFGQFSNVAILANILVLPLVPLAMVLTFIAGAVALIVPALAVVAGFPAMLVLGYMTKVTFYLGNVSWAQTTLTITPYIVASYYVTLVGACFYIAKKTGHRFIQTKDLNLL